MTQANQQFYNKSVLIATLGSEPQVITAAIDLLTARGEPPSDIWVVHTVAAKGTSVHNALLRLQAEISAEFHPILDGSGQPCDDLDSLSASENTFRLLYRLVRRAKLTNNRVHLSIAGGRKTMSVYGMAAAQLLFDTDDRLWHLFSAGDFLNSKRLHPTPEDDVRMVRVPVVLWRQVSPVLVELNDVEDPYIALERIEKLQLHRQMEESRTFVERILTSAERRALTCLVDGGLSDAEIAKRLSLSNRTVEQQLRSAYLKAESFWGLNQPVSRAQLICLTKLYYAFQLGEIPHAEEGA